MSPQLMSVLVMSKRFSRPPSEIIGVQDPYDAFCFDEACMFIMYKLDSGEKIKYHQDEGKEEKHYSKLSDMYKDLGIISDE